MKKEEVYITNNSKETQKVGEDFVQQAQRSDLSRLQGQALQRKHAFIIALHGDLGGGKTTFTQGIARGLGIKRRIISPTFVIVRQYNLRDYSSSGAQRSREVIKADSSRQARTINFYHIDLYRVESLKDIEMLGIEEIINDPKNIVVIEWAEKIKDLLPKERIDIHFEYISDDKRKVTFYE